MHRDNYSCDFCNYENDDEIIFREHLLQHRLQCRDCDAIFYRQDNLDRHIQYCHLADVWTTPQFGRGAAPDFESQYWQGFMTHKSRNKIGLHEYDYQLNFKGYEDEHNIDLVSKIAFVKKAILDIADFFRKKLTHDNDKLQIIFNAHPDSLKASYRTRFYNKSNFLNED